MVNPVPFLLFPLIVVTAYLLGGSTVAGIFAGISVLVICIANKGN